MSYQILEARFREIAHLNHAEAMLGWDEAVIMPAGGGDARGQALATLAGVIHERLAAPDMGDLLANAAATDGTLSAPQQANLREMRRLWRDATALPVDLVRARQIAVSRCEQVWRVKRGENDWHGVVLQLGEVLDRAREVADCYAALDGGSPYDALLTRHQPGTSEAEIEQVFGALQVFLPGFVDRIIAAQPGGVDLPDGFPVARQQALGERLMRTLGFDFDKGRLDVSHHPFSGGVPDDTRITTRYGGEGFLTAQMAVLHETGHGLYQQGLPAAWRDQPLGDHAGVAVHESQSLLMEMQVARSRPFLRFAAPVMQEMLSATTGADPRWSGENLYANATRVRRGLIRVDADELTYPLHVILRFDLERKLLSGALRLVDLPDAWDGAMRNFLNLSTRGDFRNGCMQDVHWYAGMFGYFPCYTLGALMAAQLMAAARRALPDLEVLIGHGDIAPLREWLRANVHTQGRQLSMQALLTQVTGEPLNAQHFLDHVKRRYLRQGW